MPQVVLVGAGHTHIQVLRHWMMHPDPAVEATLVVDTPIAVYSGMAPGLIAGQYERHELEIDAVPLARRAGVRVVLAPCTGVEATNRRVLVEGREPLPFDVASFDVGSTVAGLELPGVRKHAVPTRPINRLAAAISGRVEALTSQQPNVVVVGSGAGGIELAFCIDARLRGLDLEPRVTIVEAGDRILPGYHPALTRRIEAAARERGLRTLVDTTVAGVEEHGVRLEDGRTLDSDLTFWVTGAAALPIFRGSDLPLCDRGFARTRSTLQVEGHDHIFAVGDCATLIDQPNRPRAGVYAVRMGPYLIENLERQKTGQRLRHYRPQGDFLALLNLGDGRAAGAKWGAAFEGRWVMRLKDRIDRRFMERFQALDPEGAALPAFGAMRAGPDAHTANGEPQSTPMFCGGCAAKVGPDRLARALARAGLDARPEAGDQILLDQIILDTGTPDDAVAYRTPAGDRIVASLDAFPAFTDDPWLVGRVAAVNACSDLHATGVTPRFAQALVTLPQEADGRTAEELLIQVLAGARAALDPEGVQLLGGHTNTGPELVVGFHVEGLSEDGRELLLKSRVRPGEALVLTKPLGSGVLLAADRMGLCPGRWLRSCLASMQTSNRGAMEAARRVGVAAATDVSGFGLAGHLGEMAQASGVDLEIYVAALPALPGALELLGRGERSTSHDQNTRLPVEVERLVAPGARLDLAFDPQTAGGLVLAVDAKRADVLLSDLKAQGLHAAAVIARARAARSGKARLTLA
ncbi:MAG: selenide, water dikinase SelD [Holophagales bacterium]|nr:selenide, water dikinase SelD [Holophagales bacterium]MYG29588.1 selenide, water dikinase SelD [Holophagales bacterium]MYI79894.1 selenide, water dikinase SelD [Holophagales bacterium]